MSSIIFQHDGPIVRIRLNRPEVRNALNGELVQGLLETFEKIGGDDAIRVVILSGEGGTFCAGGDLNWLKSSVGASKEVFENDSRQFGKVLRTICDLPKPVIAEVRGAAIGGGVGLVSVADMVVASEETVFALAEAKLGLVPAVISPYVIARMGVSQARRYFLTGERFEAQAALGVGLIHEVVEEEDLETKTLEWAKNLLSSGPEAIAACKELIRKVGGAVSPEIEDYTVKKLSEVRDGPEAQEGIKAFLEKRRPNWCS